MCCEDGKQIEINLHIGIFHFSKCMNLYISLMPNNLSDIDNDIVLKIPKLALGFKKKRIGGDALC